MKHHYNKEELIELKRKYDMQVSKEAIEEIKHTIDLDREIERLHSIIKEVREYITYARTPRTIYESGYGKGTCVEICMEHLLEILDKENNET